MNIASTSPEIHLNPTLEERLRCMQSKAVQIEGLLSAVLACVDDPERRGLVYCLVEGAIEAANDLNSGLDIVNLERSSPRG